MAERPARRRKSSKSVEQLKAEISARDEEKASKAVSRKPSGAAAEAQEAARKRKNAAKYEQEKAERAKKGSSGYGYSQHLMGGSSSSSGFNPRSVREELLVDYLLGEGFASDEKSAQAIAGAMSEEWVQSIVEQASTVSSSGGAGGKVTVNKSYPATLNNQKGVKSTGPTGTEYFTPNFPGSNVPNRAEAKFKSVASQQYEKVPSDQRTMDLNKPVSVTDRTKYDPSYKPPGMRK